MKYFSLVLFVVVLAGCSGMLLKPAEFAWPVESVMTVDSKGMVQEDRYSMSFSVKPILLEETGDTMRMSRHTVRMIRDDRGYYFLTAAKFKNVYVLTADDGALKVATKILVKETGLDNPAFNQRPPYIQVLNEKD
ncbi:MAG: hypothetical protein AABZ41_08295, partial [Bacteroidota bacterium]